MFKQPLTQQNWNKKPSGFDRDFDSDSGEDDVALVEESDIQFQDNPVLKDFLNLSNGGARLI
jgi:hypothetical protein